MHVRALWRLRAYVRPYIGALVLTTVAALVAVACAVAVPLVTKSVVDGPLRRGDSDALLPLAALALALGGAEAFLAFVRRYSMATAALGIETDMRNAFYAHLQKLHVGFHDGWQSGQLLSRAHTDINVIRRFIGFGGVFLLVNTITYVVVIALLARLHLGLACVTALSTVPIVLLTRSFRKRYAVVSRRVQDQQGDLTTHVEEAAQGIRVIKAFGRRDLAARQFDTHAKAIHATSMEMARLRAVFWSSLGIIPNAALAIVLLGGAVAVSNGNLTIGGLVAFVTLVLMLVWPVESLGEILAMSEEAATGAERLLEVFDVAPAIVDKPDAVAAAPATSRGHVRFESVEFAYPADSRPVLHRVDLEVRPGETVALVGATGSGKTTLLALLPRLHDVTAGRILLDGVDVRDLTLDSLRGIVNVAFEDPLLFSASVRENILLGRPDATDDDVRRALRVAQAQFVLDLPWGLDTRVGEQGLSLSGGQRQRVALARAIVARPRVLVMDDPLSALDVHTEERVQLALESELQGTTVLIAVHRPSTVALADRVALLDGGRIVATGTHHELIESNARYRAILSEGAERPAGLREAG